MTLGRLNNGEVVDDLSYRYSGNRLMNVRDASGHPFGYDNTGALTEDRYEYDANGNMTKDLNNGITGVSYNFLNLPRQVTRGGQTVKYVYSASGAKLKNILPGKTMEYVDGFVYEDGLLSYILTGEGRYVANGSTGTHEYNLTDHLGNIRVVIDQEGSVLQKTDYYPFGMPIARAGGSDNKYLYNGKEEQEETGWLDYGARMYDTSIGRWFVQDPLSELNLSTSGYAYVSNNPIRYIDFAGLTQDDPPVNEIWLPEVTVVGHTKKWNSASYFPNFPDFPFSSFMQEEIERMNRDRLQQANYALDQWKEEKIRLSTLSWNTSTSMIFDGIGGFGDGMKILGGSFRLTNGKLKNQISIKHYVSNWPGGSRGFVTTYSMLRVGQTLGRYSLIGSSVLSAWDIGEAFIQDGHSVGQHTVTATAKTVGGLVGAWAGSKAGGAAVGAWPGLLIGAFGGAIGGYFGGEFAEGFMIYIYDWF